MSLFWRTMEPKKPSYLRKRRQQIGISIRELAKIVKIAPNRICNLEYGRQSCGELSARRFGEVFDEDWNNFLSKKET